jgi:hypothetical protein
VCLLTALSLFYVDFVNIYYLSKDPAYVILSNLPPRLRIVDMVVIFGLQTVPLTSYRFVCGLPSTKFHIFSYSCLLVFTTAPKDKETFHIAAILFYIV